MDEFDEWATLHGYIPGFNSYCHAKKAWLESASRADHKIKELEEKLKSAQQALKDILIELYETDRRAREECAEIYEQTRTAYCSSNGQACAASIRATIKEDK